MSAIDNLRLTAKLIPIIAPFIGVCDIRYYLRGINVRPHADGGAVICATNGHALGAIHDPDAVCDAEVTLRLDPRMLQSCGARVKESRIIKVMNGRLVVVEGQAETEVYIQAGDPLIDGCTYPRYEKVIPKAERVKPGMLGTYNYGLIALVERAAVAAAKAKRSNRYDDTAIHFFNVGEDNGCGVVRFNAAPEFVGVLMPMRSDARLSFVPSWAERLPREDDLAGMATSRAAATEPEAA
jgi:hypothetical protein